MHPLLKVIIFSTLSLLVMCGAARITRAASLVISPSSASVAVGETITLSILVSSPSQAINVVSGSLTFDSSYVKIKSLSTSGSIVKFWIKEPVKSGSSTVDFEGVILNPGYIGPSGKVFTITLDAQSVGNPVFKIDNAAILANDGAGTDVTTPSLATSVTITLAEVKPTPAPDKPSEKSPSVETATDVPATESTVSSELKITSVPIDVNQGDSFSLSGTTPNKEVSVFVVKTGAVGALDRTVLYNNLTEGGYLIREEATVANNRFETEFRDLAAGRYAFYAKDTMGNVTSIHFVDIKSSQFTKIKAFVHDWWWTGLLGIGLLFLLVVLLRYASHVKMFDQRDEISALLEEEQSVYDHIIHKLDHNMPLSDEEHEFIRRVRKNHRN